MAAYNKRKALDSATQKTLEVLGQEILVEEQDEFNALVKTHEEVIGKLIGQTPIQERLFPDFNGQIKSLGLGEVILFWLLEEKIRLTILKTKAIPQSSPTVNLFKIKNPTLR